MSFKAYFVRLRDTSEVEDLATYLKKLDGIAFMNYVGSVKRNYLSFSKGEIIAAITVDRGDMRESFRDEGGVKPLYTKHIDYMPVIDGDSTLINFLKTDKDNWVDDCRKYFASGLKIRIIGYPTNSEFDINGTELPAFKYGCKVREKYLHKHLKGVEYTAPHAVRDFIVEHINKTKDGEDWYLGS